MSHLVARVAALLQQLSEDLDLTVDAPGGPAVEAPAAAAAPSAAGSAADGNAAQQPVGASAATAAHTASAGLACESVQTALRPFQRCGGGDAASPHAAGRTDAWAEGSVRGGCRADSRRPGALAAGASEAAVVGPQSALSGSSAAGKRTAVEVRPLCSTLSAAQRCDSVASASGGGRVGALKRPRDESDSAQAAGPRPCCQAAEPTPEALGHTDAPARQSAAERGRDEANREEIWCAAPCKQLHLTCALRIDGRWRTRTRTSCMDVPQGGHTSALVCEKCVKCVPLRAGRGCERTRSAAT